MFISRKRYELICEIVVDQDKKIKELQNTIDDMKIERIHTNAIMNRINNERSGLIRFISSKTLPQWYLHPKHEHNICRNGFP